MRRAVIVAVVTIVVVGLITLFAFAVSQSGTGYDERIAECKAQGGTVKLNRWNEYDGCLIGQDR